MDTLSNGEKERLWAEEALRRHESIIKRKARLRKSDTVIKAAKAHLK